MKFDVVVGNPPYQETLKDTSDGAIYHHFYNLAEKSGVKYCLISPARFLFNAGNTDKSWNEHMLSDKHVKVVYYNPEASEVFPHTGFKGGVAVLYRDEEKDFGAIGVFTAYSELNSIVRKVVNKDNFESIISSIYLQEKFDLEALYRDHNNLKAKIGSKGKEKRLTTSIFSTVDIFSDVKISEDDVGILGLIKNKRFYKFINRNYLEDHPNLDKWKVILPKSNGSGSLGEVLSSPLVGKPLVGYTQSFISIGSFDTSTEAENALKYIKSKFARTLLGVLKVTQDNNPPTWAKVPLQDFSPESDIDWTKSIAEIDRQLYEKYGLSAAEIEFIETKVKAMD